MAEASLSLHQNDPEKTPTLSILSALFQAISNAERPPNEHPAIVTEANFLTPLFFLIKGYNSLSIKAEYFSASLPFCYNQGNPPRHIPACGHLYECPPPSMA